MLTVYLNTDKTSKQVIRLHDSFFLDNKGRRVPDYEIEHKCNTIRFDLTSGKNYGYLLERN